MIVPYHADVPMAHLPIANWIIIGAVILVSVWFWTTYPAADEEVANTWLLSRETFQVHQLLTSQLLHADWWHLLGNMLFLWVFGNAVNGRVSHWLYVTIYIGGGVVANVFWLLMSDGLWVLGASGAISGVVGMFVAYYPWHRVRMCLWLFLVYVRRFTVPGFLLVMFYTVYDLIGTLYSSDGIAYIAHVAGTVHGFLAACILVRLGVTPNREHRPDLARVFGLRDTPPRPGQPWQFK